MSHQIKIKQDLDLADIGSDETAGYVFWEDVTRDVNGKVVKVTSSFVYDPFRSNKAAFSKQFHNHTSWAEYICDRTRYSEKLMPADRNMKKRPLLIVGRGNSAKENLDLINSRKIPAIFLNHAVYDFNTMPGDFAVMIDSRIMPWFRGGDKDVTLLTFPGISHEITVPGNSVQWAGVEWFIFFTNTHMNNWMRKKFPMLPPVADYLTVCACAAHIGALWNADPIIFIGTDFCFTELEAASMSKTGLYDIPGFNGKNYKTVKDYAQMSQAVGMLSYFCNAATGSRYINASGNGILGFDILSNGKKMTWIDTVSPEEVSEWLN